MTQNWKTVWFWVHVHFGTLFFLRRGSDSQGGLLWQGLPGDRSLLGTQWVGEHHQDLGGLWFKWPPRPGGKRTSPSGPHHCQPVSRWHGKMGIWHTPEAKAHRNTSFPIKMKKKQYDSRVRKKNNKREVKQTSDHTWKRWLQWFQTPFKAKSEALNVPCCAFRLRCPLLAEWRDC